MRAQTEAVQMQERELKTSLEEAAMGSQTGAFPAPRSARSGKPSCTHPSYAVSSIYDSQTLGAPHL